MFAVMIGSLAGNEGEKVCEMTAALRSEAELMSQVPVPYSCGFRMSDSHCDPPMDDLERRLAAIMAADVAGYSRLTGVDEEGTLRRIRELRDEVIDPSVRAQRGRIAKEMGDGLLIEFVSVLDAVRAALDIHRQVGSRNAGVSTELRLDYRIGIHIGDIIVQPDGDVLGDTVNIAARLEGLSEPGGVCLSEDAYRQIRNRVRARFKDLGEQTLKNIALPMRVHSLEVGNRSRPRKARSGQAEGPKKRTPTTEEQLKLPKKIVVAAPGLRVELETVDRAVRFIDMNVPRELARLPRWTFARALFLEALQTRKSRDLRAAARQLRQALSNEKWLENE